MTAIREETILGAIRAELDHMEIEGGFDARPETRWDHLDLDPRDLVELLEALEERFAIHIPCGAWKSAATVGDAIALIQALREPALAA
jgi:acyl carrier protein